MQPARFHGTYLLTFLPLEMMTAPTQTVPLRILVVENHPDTLASLKLYLEEGGHILFTAVTVAEALRLLQHHRYDVLLCDIGLPDGTGWQLMEALQAAGVSVFSVAMSGFGRDADSKKSRDSGFRHHLLKPFKGAELDRLLAQAAAELGGLPRER